MESKKRLKGQLNKGFSLFTVIIAVSFVMILGLLVIYISVSNFYMKVTDLKGKDSFYTAEQGLEEIKVGLQQDVGTAMIVVLAMLRIQIVRINTGNCLLSILRKH